MSPGGELLELKKRMSPLLLPLAGVQGVGISGGRLVVYLAEGSDAVRRQVSDIVEAEAPGTNFNFVVTGRFRPL